MRRMLSTWTPLVVAEQMESRIAVKSIPTDHVQAAEFMWHLWPRTSAICLQVAWMLFAVQLSFGQK